MRRGRPQGEQMETEASPAPQRRGFAWVENAVGHILPLPTDHFALLGWCHTPSSCSSQWELSLAGIMLVL